MLMNKLLGFILIFGMITPSFGQGFTQLSEGQQAPYSGWLYSEPAHDKLIEKLTFNKKEFELYKAKSDVELILQEKYYKKLLVIEVDNGNDKVELLLTELGDIEDKSAYLRIALYITGTLAVISTTVVMARR